MKKLILFIAILALSGCGFQTISTGHMGVHRTWHKIDSEPFGEGFYWYNPISADIYEYDVRQKTWEGKTEIFTKDTQKVTVAFAVMYAPDAVQIGTILRNVGGEDVLLRDKIKPTVLGSIKDMIGQVIADELVGKRAEVTKESLNLVRENLKAVNVNVQDLQFTNLDFDTAYEKAVEDKVVADQNAKKAINDSKRIKEEAHQIEMTAIANANAMRIKSAALAQNKGLVQFEAVQRWNGVLPQYMFGNSTPFIDLRGLGKE